MRFCPATDCPGHDDITGCDGYIYVEDQGERKARAAATEAAKPHCPLCGMALEHNLSQDMSVDPGYRLGVYRPPTVRFALGTYKALDRWMTRAGWIFRHERGSTDRQWLAPRVNDPTVEICPCMVPTFKMIRRRMPALTMPSVE